MLPDGIPCLQTGPDIPENQIVEQVVVLDSVYPRTDLTVSEEPETYTSTTEDEDGNETSETYYRLRYDASFLFSESYVLPNEELHIIFQSGLLNGMEFGAKFNPKGLNEKNSDGTWNPDAQMIEVVVNEDYGRRLPDDVLKPQKGDKFILSGWDSTKMADLGLIADAEQELLEEGKKALDEYTKDLSTCTCPMAWDYMKPLFETNSQPKPGDVVTIIDTAHFGTGGRKSRIIGFEYKLDKPYAECVYTCGENVSVKRLDSIEKKIDGLSKSGTKVQIQNSLDFLSKRYSDRTPYKVSSDVGFEVGEFREGLSGGMIGMDRKNGGSFGEFDRLFIRQIATFMQLVINELNVQQGDTLYSEGDTVESVEFDGLNADGTARWWVNIHPRHESYVTAFQPGMILMGTVNNLYDAAIEGNPATYYTSYMRVNGPERGTSGNRLNVTVYADDEVLGGRNFPPCALMTLGRWGHQTEALYQRLFRLSSHEGTLVRYEGVNKPIIDFSNIASFIGRAPEGWFTNIPGVKVGDEIAYFKTVLGNFIQIDHHGKPVPVYIYTGPYDPARVYHCDWMSENGVFLTETCTYCGCIWQAARDGIVGIAPDYGTTAWAFREGNPEFRVDFEEKQVCYSEEDIALFGATLTLTATLYNQDVLSFIRPEQVTWSRVSYDSNGVLRAGSDALWRPTTDNGNRRLLLTASDLDYDGTPLGRVTFTARVAIDDTEVAEVSMEFA